jgi:leader peptidase (prepilin peptidase)/N-methyltransferase
VNAVALASALLGGLVIGRLAAAVADRYAPRRGPRRPVAALELFMAGLLVLVIARFGVGWNTIPPLIAAASLVTLATVDWRSGRLPDVITVPAAAGSLAAIGIASIATGEPGAIVAAVGAALGYGAVMWAAHELRPNGLGFGDVKLSPLLGLHIGWTAVTFGQGWLAVVSLVAQALILSCLIGLGMGLVLGLVRRRRARQPDLGHGSGLAAARLLDTAFPFGPALAAGTMIAVLFPEVLLI